ncbi:protoporphyrinogen oxidase [Enteractinococcus fodinae]|uniref:Oxygen-dependent protoporphyrinogen oxidase n=1 Tax=Enteractinococcus fodinae TaxID=684663 RepID=A0ABU2AZ94_9MICC|nr:FAD-dependent oxidoreductase [Enteractinococcus fodinae]MDR7346673.1 oxygen-dependent protoporphyrinogen oxidase [Enteractinococcus fodinae]
MAHVVVVGAGYAGLVAAYTAVQAGHSVTVLEAAPTAGGAIQPLTFDLPEGPLTVDAGAEAYAARSQQVEELIAELGLGEDLVTPDPAGSWLYLPEVGAVPAPKVGMWGIPGHPSAPEVIQALGPAGAARAAQELAMPMHNWALRRAAGEPITVGELVVDRFGTAVLNRLVAPVVAGVHSADPYDVDIETIAPGLIDAAIQHDSVALAIAERRAAAPPGAAVKTLAGGMHRLVAALVEYLQDRAQVRFNTEVTALAADGPAVLTAAGERITADRIVVAINGPSAFDLMAPVAQLTDRPELGAGVALVALVVDDPRLNDHPRGTGMLVSPAATTVAAKAATHVTAKWDWARQAATAQADHRHVLRLSYGRITDPADGSAPGHDTADAQLFDLALSDAAAMFGLKQAQLAEAVVAQQVIRWREAMPLTTPENAQRLKAMTQAARATDWLHVTGAWFAGTGLAAITKHATELYPLQ